MGMNRRNIGLALATLFLAAACGGTAAPAPTATTAASAAPTKPPRAAVKVAIGSAASLNYLSWDLAKALGYFEDENLDVTLTYSASGNDAATALLSGSVDFTGNSMDQSIKAQIAGKPTKMVVSFSKTPGAAIVVRKDLEPTVKTLKDLKGKTVGATGQGTGTHVVLTYALNQAGLVQDKDYTFKPCGSGTMAATLDSKGADACINSDPYITQYVAAGKGFILKDYRTIKDTTELIGGTYQFTGAVTTADFIQKNPDVVQRVVNALVKTNKYVQAAASKDIAAKLPKTVTGEDIDLYIRTLDAAKGYISADGIIDPAGAQNVLKMNVEDCKVNTTLCGNVKPDDKVDVNALFDNTFAEKANKK
jgi:NitT/TauT family transport system substrate-binding protein